MTHARVSKEGRQIGGATAKLVERGLHVLAGHGLLAVSAPGLRSEMCASCAGKSGTVPNGCLQTQMDFLKAVVEGVPFLCHAPCDGSMCAGWVSARAAHVADPLPQQIVDLAQQWEFTLPDELAEKDTQ